MIYGEIGFLGSCREAVGEGTLWCLMVHGQVEMPKQKKVSLPMVGMLELVLSGPFNLNHSEIYKIRQKSALSIPF